MVPADAEPEVGVTGVAARGPWRMRLRRWAALPCRRDGCVGACTTGNLGRRSVRGRDVDGYQSWSV
jgi:hypothetical protein